MTIRNILLATDFTKCSDRAADNARDFAGRFKATVHLLHIITQPLHEAWAGYSRAADLVAEVDALEVSARRELDTLVAEWSELAGNIEITTGFGDPATEILKYACEHDIDLIVCGTHGRRGLERAVMGSVAENLVRRAGCPVLTVGPSRQPSVEAA